LLWWVDIPYSPRVARSMKVRSAVCHLDFNMLSPEFGEQQGDRQQRRASTLTRQWKCLFHEPCYRVAGS
jgi:hypothetical protein